MTCAVTRKLCNKGCLTTLLNTTGLLHHTLISQILWDCYMENKLQKKLLWYQNKNYCFIPTSLMFFHGYSWVTLPLSQCVLTWGCVSNLGKQTLKQLPWNRIIMTKKGEQECKTCLENWLYNIKIRLLLHIWHFI